MRYIEYKIINIDYIYDILTCIDIYPQSWLSWRIANDPCFSAAWVLR